MSQLFIDSDVVLYGFGAEHPRKRHSVALMAAAARGDVGLHLSVEALQEIVFHRMRRTDRAAAARQTRDVDDLATSHPFDQAVWLRAMDLIETTAIRGRDAVHAATALEAGFSDIVAWDDDYAGVPGLTRIAPDRVLEQTSGP